MRITFITGHLCKERHALLNELVLDLGEYGADVTVITGFPSRRISQEVRKYYLNHPSERISDNVVVKRVGSRKGEGKGLFSRMVKYILLTRKIYKEAKKTPTDIYYIYSSPPFLGYIGCKLAKKAPTLYNAQDLFPDTLLNIKRINEKNIFIRWFRKKEKQVYKDNTKIVTISEDMKKTIISNSGCNKEKVEVIYNWADTVNLCHINKSENKLFQDLKIPDNKFIISYAGDIGLFQGWDKILDAAKIIQEKNRDIFFVLIGSGSYKEILKSRVYSESITNVLTFPLQPVDRVSEIYSIGDMELVPLEKGITKMALPSKTSVIMSVGSPILALVDKGSDIEHFINDNKIGLAIENGDAEKIAEAIEYCYNSRQNLSKWGENAKNFANKNFARKIQTEKYYSVLCEMLNT